MIYPDLTICILTCRRPWYAAMTLSACKQIQYAGKVKFHIADGGSNPNDFQYFQKIADGQELTIETVGNPSWMINSCAHHGGEIWVMAVDDMCPRFPFDITPDVDLLLTHPEIGCVRFSRLAFWGSLGEDPETSADLVKCDGMHWWRIDKARSKDSYICSVGFHLYHRRFWDTYGDLEKPARANELGHAEMIAGERFRMKDGPTIAVPMRFGQDAGEFREPIWHFGIWRTDELTKVARSRL